ncbi:MAG: transglutaminaseTgpA domain-containing protein [Acidimicrobiales bacterium]
MTATRDQSAPAPLILEVAAAVLVPAACIGLLRVFDSGDAVATVAGTALLSTAVAVTLRRLRVGLLPASLISIVVLGVLLMNRFAPGTARLGLIPTGDTVDGFRALGDELVANFRELKAPVPAVDPFMAAAMVAAWSMAMLTDWGALRLRLAFEPVLPAGLIFVFSSLLGAGSRPVAATVVFGATVGFWAVTQRTANLVASNSWLINERRRGARSLAVAGAVFAAAAVIAGAVAGPHLPGAEAEPVVSFREADDPTREVVTPFVSLESRLVEQADVELFTVAANQPSYWRLAGLDQYDDFLWTVTGNFTPEDSDLPSLDTVGGTRDLVTQTYTIEALDAIWVPAAFTPARIVDTSTQITWNAETSSLTVANGVNSSDGAVYSIESMVPRFSAAELAASPEGPPPPEIAARDLALPQISPMVGSIALEVTQDAPTRYDKMLALQAYFREFEYSVDLSPRAGDRIEQFLTERTGFCQHFAATYALMARSLGIPARVATGFTWGDPISTDQEGQTIYQVTGRQAHAWPEIWFNGIGWVPFEPTPGRGAPEAVGYSTVPAVQDSLVQPDNPGAAVTTTETTAAATPDTTMPLTEDPLLGADDLTEAGATPETEDVGAWPSLATALKILGVLVLLALALAALPALYLIRRLRRRQQATTPAARVEAAWADLSEDLELGFNLVRRPAETRREFAQRLHRDTRIPQEAFAGTAGLATTARYAPGLLSEHDATAATAWAAEVDAVVRRRVGLIGLGRRLLDPRRALGRRARPVPVGPPRPLVAPDHTAAPSDLVDAGSDSRP